MPRTTIGLAELPESPHFLYWLFDRTDALLYIGITNDPKARFKHHRRHKEWWPDVDQTKTRIDYFPTRHDALAAEAKAIREKQPLYNDQHNLTVDTPLTKAVEAAKSKFAESIIKRLVGGQDAFEATLKDAAECIEEAQSQPDPDWSVFSDDPAIYGAALAAERASGDVWHYKRAVELLLEALPIAQVERCRKKAVADLSSEDYEPPESDIVCATAGLLVEELGDEYLDSLDQEEARGWRRAAKAMLHERASRQFVVQHAAAYAKAFKADRRYDQAWRLCTARDQSQAACASVASLLAHFEHCPNCEGDCVGHRYWCELHLEAARCGQFRWRRDDSMVILARTSEPENHAIEEPVF